MLSAVIAVQNQQNIVGITSGYFSRRIGFTVRSALMQRDGFSKRTSTPPPYPFSKTTLFENLTPLA